MSKNISCANKFTINDGAVLDEVFFNGMTLLALVKGQDYDLWIYEIYECDGEGGGGFRNIKSRAAAEKTLFCARV